MIATLKMIGPPPTQFSPNRAAFERHGGGRKVSTASQFVEIQLPGIKGSSTRLKGKTTNISHVVFLSLRVIPDRGIPLTLTNVPFAVSGDPRHETRLDSTTQDTPWRFRITTNAATKQVAFNFKLEYEGLSTHEALRGVRFYQFLANGGKLQVIGRHPITGQDLVLFTAGIPGGTYTPPNRRLIHVLERLSFIARRCDVLLKIPPGDITAADANVIESTARIIETGHGEYDTQPWTSVSNVEQAEKALEDLGGGRSTEMAIYFEGQEVRIFGVPINLGPVALFTKAYITPEDLQDLKQQLKTATSDTPVKIKLTPFERAPVKARYPRWLPEDEAKAMEHMPFYKKDDAYTGNSARLLPPINVPNAISLLQSWYDEDAEEQKRSWEDLKLALDRDRLSDRKFFP